MIKHAQFDNSGYMLATSISGSYQNLLALADDASVLLCCNSLNRPVVLSLPNEDGTSGTMVLPIGGSFALDFQNNAKRIAMGVIQVKALSYLQEYLTHTLPNDVRYMGLLNLGKAAGVTGRYATSLDALTQAHALIPEWGMAIIVLAKVYATMGNYEMALAILKSMDGVNIPSHIPIFKTEYDEEVKALFRDCQSKQNVQEIICSITQ